MSLQIDRQFWHFPILTLSNFFQNGQKLDSDTFQFWHFPIPPLGSIDLVLFKTSDMAFELGTR